MLTTSPVTTVVITRPRAFITAEFEFDANYVSGNSVRLKFTCRIYMPLREDIPYSQRTSVQYGLVNYREIAEMVVELLRMAVNGENKFLQGTWRAGWDRTVYADKLVTRLRKTLKALTGLDYEVASPSLEIVHPRRWRWDN